MPRANRRQFLKSSAAAAGTALLATPAIARAGANDRLRVAIAGLGGRGGIRSAMRSTK